MVNDSDEEWMIATEVKVNFQPFPLRLIILLSHQADHRVTDWFLIFKNMFTTVLPNLFFHCGMHREWYLYNINIWTHQISSIPAAQTLENQYPDKAISHQWLQVGGLHILLKTFDVNLLH